MPQNWSDNEIDVAVAAYLTMLEAEQLGDPLVKSDVNRRLRDGELSDRSKSSVEYRMQNISAVLMDIGQHRIQGYVPAANVGAGVRESIMASLERSQFLKAVDYSATSDRAELDTRTRRLKQKGFSGKPKGATHPQKTEIHHTEIQREPAVRAWVLVTAGGICELCKSNAPFLDSHGEPYLEAHHVHSLGEGGPDVVENAVALCPNCHRQCHHSEDMTEARDRLYETVARLVR